MRYYAIKDKESGAYVRYINETYKKVDTTRYLEEANFWTLENIASICIKEIKKWKNKEAIKSDFDIVPIELYEVEQPKEQPSLRELLNNIPVKKPKWYEIRPNVMVRLDRIEKLELCISPNNPTNKRWRVWLTTNNSSCSTDDLTEEEATAKYNELKKLLEEV